MNEKVQMKRASESLAAAMNRRRLPNAIEKRGLTARHSQ